MSFWTSKAWDEASYNSSRRTQKAIRLNTTEWYRTRTLQYTAVNVSATTDRQTAFNSAVFSRSQYRWRRQWTKRQWYTKRSVNTPRGRTSSLLYGSVSLPKLLYVRINRLLSTRRHIGRATSLSTFKRHLKTVLFTRSYPWLAPTLSTLLFLF